MLEVSNIIYIHDTDISSSLRWLENKENSIVSKILETKLPWK